MSRPVINLSFFWVNPERQRRDVRIITSTFYFILFPFGFRTSRRYWDVPLRLVSVLWDREGGWKRWVVSSSLTGTPRLVKGQGDRHSCKRSSQDWKVKVFRRCRFTPGHNLVGVLPEGWRVSILQADGLSFAISLVRVTTGYLSRREYRRTKPPPRPQSVNKRYPTICPLKRRQLHRPLKPIRDFIWKLSGILLTASGRSE